MGERTQIRTKKKSKENEWPFAQHAHLYAVRDNHRWGGLYGLKQMGFWSGNFEELQTVDYLTAAKTAWEKGMVEVNKLAGNEVAIQAVGTITITEKTEDISKTVVLAPYSLSRVKSATITTQIARPSRCKERCMMRPVQPCA